MATKTTRRDREAKLRHDEERAPAPPDSREAILPLSTLHRCASILAGNDPDMAREKNNVGFNKFDGEFGHVLANAPFDQWTWKMVTAAYKLLRKYHGQLASAGINFDRIQNPNDPIVFTVAYIEEFNRQARKAWAIAHAPRPEQPARTAPPIPVEDVPVALDVWFDGITARTYNPDGREWQIFVTVTAHTVVNPGTAAPRRFTSDTITVTRSGPGTEREILSLVTDDDRLQMGRDAIKSLGSKLNAAGIHGRFRQIR